MKSSWKIVLVVVCMAVLSLLAVTVTDHPKEDNAAVRSPKLQVAEAAANQKMIDTAVTLLRSGYVVLRMGLGADSRMLALMNQKDKSYSHCGIVMMEHGYPFVYHSIGGEDNPDARMRRDSASHFFSARHNVALAIVQYDLETRQVGELQKAVYRYYAQRPLFDMKFDLRTDDKLYCAEFVYKALNKAANDTGYIKTTHAAGYKFVGIDDLFVNPHAHIVWQTAFK